MACTRSTGQEAGKINVHKTKRSITERGRERKKMSERQTSKGRDEREKREQEEARTAIPYNTGLVQEKRSLVLV